MLRIYRKTDQGKYNKQTGVFHGSSGYSGMLLSNHSCKDFSSAAESVPPLGMDLLTSTACWILVLLLLMEPSPFKVQIAAAPLPAP
ncbi:hypothetical protein D3C85_1617370 [compost metagenome]